MSNRTYKRKYKKRGITYMWRCKKYNWECKECGHVLVLPPDIIQKKIICPGCGACWPIIWLPRNLDKIIKDFVRDCCEKI